MNEPETIRKILSMKTIAVVGLSPRFYRPSHTVSRFMKDQGYRIIPVNPNCAEVLGEKSYPSLKDIPESVEVVNVFRQSQHVDLIAEDAIAMGAKALWLQDGVINQKAAKKAEEAGLLVVMDDCVMRQHRLLSTGIWGK